MDALVIVDGGQIVGDRDGADGAVLLAEHTADAADVADLTQIGAALVGRTADKNVFGLADDRNDLSGAGCNALAAGFALDSINNGSTVDDVDGIIGAGLDAGAEAETAVGSTISLFNVRRI